MHESLDYRLMLFMSGLLAVMLSVLLLAINRRTATLHGLTSWVYANIFLVLQSFSLLSIPFLLIRAH